MVAARKPNRAHAPRRAFPDVSEALVRRYGILDGPVPRMGQPPTTTTVRPMGPLVELSVERLSDGVIEKWRFNPWPKLVFNRASDRMWTMGRGFRFDGAGFHPTGGKPYGIKRLPLDIAREKPMRGQAREFVRSHYGVRPHEAVVGPIDPVPAIVVPLGILRSAVYRTDRNDGDGQSEWEHHFEDEGVTRGRPFTRPIVLTDRTGTGLWFAGGTYGVFDGWLGG